MTATESIKTSLTFNQILAYFGYEESLRSDYFNQYSKHGFPMITLCLNEQNLLSASVGLQQQVIDELELICYLSQSVCHDDITAVLTKIAEIETEENIDNIKHPINPEAIHADFLPYPISENHLLTKQFENITHDALLDKLFSDSQQKDFVLALHNGNQFVNLVKFDDVQYSLMNTHRAGIWNSIASQEKLSSVNVFTHPTSLLNFINQGFDKSQLLLLNFGQFTAYNLNHTASTIEEKKPDKVQFHFSENTESNAYLFTNAMLLLGTMYPLPFSFIPSFNGNEVELTFVSKALNGLNKMKFKENLKSELLSSVKKPSFEHPVGYQILSKYHFKFVDFPKVSDEEERICIIFPPKKENIVTLINYLCNTFSIVNNFDFSQYTKIH